jgi:hypothetical protein
MTFERQIATATRLITRYGARCVWREPGTPTGSPAAPVAGVPVDHDVYIVLLTNANRESLAGLLSMITDTELPTSGKRGLMPAVEFTPSLSGRICLGTTWDESTAMNLMPEKGIDLLAPNGIEPILYYLRLVG